MRLPDDDEIYDVDQTYLGPPGRFLGRFRYRALLVYPVVVAIGFAILVQTGIGVGINGIQLLATGGLLVGAKRATDWVLEHTDAERPMPVLMTALGHELTARRAERRGAVSKGSRWSAHRGTRLTTGEPAHNQISTDRREADDE